MRTPHNIRQTPARKSQIRQIQRWLSKNEYDSGYSNLKLHRCNLSDEYGRLLGLCRRGVVVAYGGGCHVAPWCEYRLDQLRRLLKAAQKSVTN